jgi:serine/threonine protein kinase
MAPEQMETEKFPIMSDFSKIDVFALGVFLINMLTLDFAFENAVEDNNSYQRFMADPSEFFERHNVNFHSQEQLDDICELLQKMLEFDLDKRISVFDAQKLSYLTSASVPRLKTDQIRKLMNQRE